jgi:hypothetical protein
LRSEEKTAEQPNSLTRGLAPHSPRPALPQPKPWGRGGGQAVFIKRRDFGKNQRHCSPKAPCSPKDRSQRLSITGCDLVSWLFPSCPLRLCGETHRPCHQPGPLMKRTRGLSQGCLGGLGVSFQIRWLTHTGREVPPSGLKSNSH